MPRRLASLVLAGAVACSDDGATPRSTDTDTDTGLPTPPPIPGDDDHDGYTEEAGDCDDADPLVHPGLPDGCDGVDTDCNGPIDDGGFAASVPGVIDGPTIQAAVDASRDGDTILVCPGTWTENVAVRGPRTLRALAGPAATAIHGGGAGSAVRIVEGAVVIEGFTLTGGAAERGGGIDGAAAADLTLIDVALVGNAATLGAGGWFGVRARLERCLIELNTAGDQGGGLGFARGGQATLVDVAIRRNVALFGGGLFAYEAARVEGTGLVVAENEAENGAGAYLWAAELVGAELVDNQATGWGGGAQLFEGGAMRSVTVRGNGAEAGGGVVARGEVTLTGVVIADNRATLQGGGLIVEDGTTFGVDAALTGNHGGDFGGGAFVRDGVLVGAQIEDNEAAMGGGVYVSTSSTSAELRDLTVGRNHAVETGGGVAATSSTVLEGVVVVDNTSAVRAAGVYLSDGTHAVIGGRIAGNRAAEFGGGLYVHSGGSTHATGAALEDNVAPLGAGIYVNGGASLTVGGGRVASNGDPETTSGGGAWVDEGTLASTTAAWPDNVPEAVSLSDGQDFDYGADPVSFVFVCDADAACEVAELTAR